MLLFEFIDENETKYIFFLRDQKKRNVRSQKNEKLTSLGVTERQVAQQLCEGTKRIIGPEI